MMTNMRTHTPAFGTYLHVAGHDFQSDDVKNGIKQAKKVLAANGRKDHCNIIVEDDNVYIQNSGTGEQKKIDTGRSYRKIPFNRFACQEDQNVHNDIVAAYYNLKIREANRR
jgi:hypothetical protein